MALTDGLISNWHFNEIVGGEWVDSFGPNNATRGGEILNTIDQKLGPGCADFDGIDDTAIVSGASSLPLGSSARAMMSWFLSADTSSNRNFTGYGNLATGQSCYFSHRSNDKLAIIFTGVGFEHISSVTASPLVFNQVIFNLASDGKTCDLYINGVYDSRIVLANTVNTVNTDGTFRFGRMSAGAFAEILVDESALWGRVLTDGGVSVGQTADGEISQLFNFGAGIEIGVGGGRRRRMEVIRRSYA